MFFDTSAIMEFLLDGPKASELLAKLQDANGPHSTNPMVIYEAAVVLAGKENFSVTEAERLVRSLLGAMDIAVVSIDDQTASAAIEAFARYGKGRHPARLNFGDCFSYAGAKAADAPLLYVGEDFARTDLA
ncbi:type II toxin-antitoxin system VapC family toxin [Rhizobium deserti]|uniref:Ribonuclease VapC n=1 Tax=Rhizobium deserti TaxID=2547961 RepID=A0A4R5UJX0_9HYPH|nr:type II toxin-antitoxin system VapC family toxin [Rhizobium deserti]TDK37094.1 type II toxin-antitoxin system VapC family toxin [Rhizobium deserti]